MSEPFQNWLEMGTTIPARIQPGSIDHVPFPTVIPCLGALGIFLTPWHGTFRSSISPARRSTLWQDQSPRQTNPPPKGIVLCPPDPYRAKELPGDP
ncbi:hypothetical protein ES332_D04G102300v1 [Gossypium tomentosum]|uniref:Uncharacterized protein n=1 Tax=Gossypium tomentosum TaxID=34277 RepID=A0A5D2LC33_GOSTO|nr:hypothetical protein ES332_D04G102300v1 [Gossypium tomentosum]